jgi:hypothetical protein
MPSFYIFFAVSTRKPGEPKILGGESMTEAKMKPIMAYFSGIPDPRKEIKYPAAEQRGIMFR